MTAVNTVSLTGDENDQVDGSGVTQLFSILKTTDC